MMLDTFMCLAFLASAAALAVFLLSDRHLRTRVLRELADGQELTAATVASRAGTRADRVTRTLEELVRQGRVRVRLETGQPDRYQRRTMGRTESDDRTRPTCCPEARASDTVTWFEDGDWAAHGGAYSGGATDAGLRPGWAIVIDRSHGDLTFGRPVCCPFCGESLPHPNGRKDDGDIIENTYHPTPYSHQR